jgi:hypothetical protein
MEHLSWLAAARHLGEFQNQPLQRMTGFHGLIGQEKGLYTLCPGYARRIVIKPIGKAAVLSEIFSIEIIVIEDYHS